MITLLFTSKMPQTTQIKLRVWNVYFLADNFIYYQKLQKFWLKSLKATKEFLSIL